METLTQTPRLIAGNQAIQNLRKTIKESQEEENLLIKEIQKNCPHTEYNEVREKKPFDGIWGHRYRLLSKTCKDCGYSFGKPEGMRWQICELCWGPMKDAGMELVGRDRTFFYKCSLCGHSTSHT